jgi:hypothetical protein
MVGPHVRLQPKKWSDIAESLRNSAQMGQLQWWKARGSLTSDVGNPVVSQHIDKCLGSKIPAVQCIESKHGGRTRGAAKAGV